MVQLEKDYREKIVPSLKKEFGFSSVMRVPRIIKINLNMGLGEAVSDKKVVTHAIDDLTKIAGQKAVMTRVKKSEAGFKIRTGWPIGCKVTLRRDRMYDFLERLISIAIPRVHDFRGYSEKSFDKNGNYSLGIKEQIVFPEIDYDKVDMIRGLDITIVTTAKDPKEGSALLKAFGFPLKT